jgi:class 3 adenylate cyclase/tetratricopeptide (TPR) repeat protein
VRCPRCQQENRPEAKFCEECAAPLVRTCPNCGNQASPSAKFCSECGHPLSTAAPPKPRFASPDVYTPKHLADRILMSKAALEGERKQVTVLFADIEGSMELLADRDPEEARKLLDPVLERMMEAVHRYEGTVNQVMGDGVMALFGAPIAHEDHAVRACYAALRMQESVKRHAGEMRRTSGVPLAIRVGLNSGEVVVRSIGSDLHMDYTAVGQTTHLAAGVEQAALPGSIVLTPDTFRLAEGFVEVRPLGAIPVKGMAEPVEVYELAGGGPARTRFQAAAARGLTRFVGRDAEVDQLRHVLDRAAAGHGQIVAIVGDAGVGKSRLLYEFTHSPRVQGWFILESGSVSYGKATAYLPVVDLLKGYFKIHDRDDQREIRDKVIGRVLGLDRVLEPLLPPVLALLDVPVDDPGWVALDPPQRRQRTLDAVKRLLLRESQVQPLLLVIEDLHWIDSETQALLDSLVESLRSIRMLLLLDYRPEYEHRWGKKTYYTRLRLESLPPGSTGELLHALLGETPGLEPLKQMLRRRGNPFFLEETVRTLVETKALEGERGAYRLVRPVHSLQIPATVQAILAARIDRLPGEDKQLLQTASVIGKDVPFGILTAIADLREEALRRALGHLQEAEFLYETTLFPDLEYTFKHALTHEVTYGGLLQDRRRTLHGQIVDTIERLYPDRVAEHVDRLAHHAFRAEAWEKAVTYLRQAGAKAFARSANWEAVAYFEHAMTALTHLPETHDTLRQAIDVRFELRNPLFALGQLERVVRHLREAEGLARALDDPHRLGWVSMYMSASLWVTGRSSEARPFGLTARAIAVSLGDLALTVGANFYLGLACHAVGESRVAEDFLRAVADSLSSELIRERCSLAGFPAVMTRCYLTMVLAERGVFDEALIHASEAVRIAEALAHPYSRIMAWWGFAHLHEVRGELDEGIRVLEHALTLCREWNIDLLAPLVSGLLGFFYALEGRIAEGFSLMHEARRDMEGMGLKTRFHTLLVGHLGEACLRVGRVEDALGFAQSTLALARQRAERGSELYALRLLAELAAHPEPPDSVTGEANYRQALALANELEMRPLVAHCHLGLGKLYRRTGNRQQAQEHLTTATTMYREMDMRFWLEQAEVEMRGLE